ncbi:hypothetical protein NJ76_28005, partial [Rhodococcus sp. IITR03]
MARADDALTLDTAEIAALMGADRDERAEVALCGLSDDEPLRFEHDAPADRHVRDGGDDLRVGSGSAVVVGACP